jgi:phosphoglycolate phosphatase-like HAD superfamily hydrolase
MTAAVLFDLDGTLIDLPVDIEPARREVERVLREAGEPGPARPLLDAIERAAARAGEGSGLRQRARAIIDAAELAAAAQARERPGAVACVSMLERRGFRLAIVTDNGRACVREALAAVGLGDVSWNVITRDDIARPKPAADGVVAAARAVCPDGGVVWYAGDSPRDVAAARAAAAELGERYHVRVVAVLGGHGSEESLREAGPDAISDDLAGFTALVGGES